MTGTIATVRENQAIYTGRFAPSPTGPLHFGSLLAAVASYLEARTRRGRWLVRIEDIDPPREQPGSAELIVEALRRYGFEWDSSILYQSATRDIHLDAVRRLLESGQAYRCSCSRTDLADAPRGPLGVIYPGTCRSGSATKETAIRVRTEDDPIEFNDLLQGVQRQNLETESGDFVIWRKDGLIAYQLAVVIDDQEQGVTDVVRGIDLLDSTPRQIWLQRLLGYPQPNYAHIPVAVDVSGNKLSKSSGAVALSVDGVSTTLVSALWALGQQPPADLASAGVADVWAWALENWNAGTLSRIREIRVNPEQRHPGPPVHSPGPRP